MKKITSKVFILILLFSEITFAQQNGYSLQSLINIALKNNTDIKIATAEKHVIQLEKTKALSGLLPNLNAEGGYIYSEEKNGAPVYAGANGKNEILALLSLRQTIFDPKVIYNYKSSLVKTDEQSFLNKQTRQNVISEVINAYFTVLKYKNEKKILTENLDAFRLMYKQSELLFETGSVPEIDVKKSKVELLLQKNALNQANKNYITAINQLKELTGIKWDEKLDIQEFHVSEVKLNSLIFYKSAAWENRPDWQIIKKQKQLMKLNASAAFMKHLPTISGNLYYGWDTINSLDKNNIGFQAVITASIPLWHWGSVSAQHQIAEIKYRQTDYRMIRLKLRILQEIENSYNEAKLQKEQISAMQESISEAKLAVKMARVGYKEGTITNLELINTLKLYTQSEMEYLKALYNFYQAKAALFKSIGKLKEDLSWIEK